MLCVLIYTRTNCGLRTVVNILKIFEEVLGDSFGKVPSYTIVAYWVRKLGLSIYKEDPPKGKKFAVIADESITINCQKLLLILGVDADYKGGPLRHKDVTVLDMKAGERFTKEDVKNELNQISANIGDSIAYGISDGGYNLVGGFKEANIPHHLDISHTLGNCMKHAYGKEPDFVALTTEISKIRLQYHLTDKAWLLPPKMRAIARFMNLRDWVKWCNDMLRTYESLDDKMKEAYAFLLSYQSLIKELNESIDAVTFAETLCKKHGFNKHNCGYCIGYILTHLMSEGSERQIKLAMEMMKYFSNQAKVLEDANAIHYISSDIIESDFGLFKSKKSPNNLYGTTSLILMLPLYPKLVNYSTNQNQNFKERLVDVKLKDVYLWTKENLPKNQVKKRKSHFKAA
jgi:hypothetical protein